MAAEILVDGNQSGEWSIVLLHRDRVGAAARENILRINDKTGAVTIDADVTLNGAVSPTLTGNSITGDFAATGDVTAGDDLIATGDLTAVGGTFSGNIAAVDADLSGVLKVDGTAVLGPQGALIASVAAAGTVDVSNTYVEAEVQAIQDLAAANKTAINLILARLRAHGIIAT